MAVVQATIKTGILAVLNSTANLELEQSKEQFAELLSQVVYSAILSATVTIPPGAVIVATAGSPAAQTGFNTAPAIGTLS